MYVYLIPCSTPRLSPNNKQQTAVHRT